MQEQEVQSSRQVIALTQQTTSLAQPDTTNQVVSRQAVSLRYQLSK